MAGACQFFLPFILCVFGAMRKIIVLLLCTGIGDRGLSCVPVPGVSLLLCKTPHRKNAKVQQHRLANEIVQLVSLMEKGHGRWGVFLPDHTLLKEASTKPTEQFLNNLPPESTTDMLGFTHLSLVAGRKIWPQLILLDKWRAEPEKESRVCCR